MKIKYHCESHTHWKHEKQRQQNGHWSLVLGATYSTLHNGRAPSPLSLSVHKQLCSTVLFSLPPSSLGI